MIDVPLRIDDVSVEYRFNYSPPGIKLSKGVSDAEHGDGDDEEGDGRPDFEAVAGGEESLDKVLEASGFSRKDQETLEQVSRFSRDEFAEFLFPRIELHLDFLLVIILS